MILAAGLTPAWQQILLFEQLRLGEVNRASEAHWCASGKVLNVGMALHHLGAQGLTLAPLGGEPSIAIEREFAQLGARRRWIATESQTRVCTTLLDRATGSTTELVENARTLSERELTAFTEAYAQEAAKSETVVLIGSLPAGTPRTFYRDLLAQTPGRVILDACGEELLSALEHRPFMVKPNHEELAQTLGSPLATDDDLVRAMRTLNQRGATWVLITRGKQAVWLSSEERIYRLQPPTVETVNPIGCGDCLAAGVAAALSHGAVVVEAVKLGMAAAAENASHLLPARFDASQIAAHLASVRVQSF